MNRLNQMEKDIILSFARNDMRVISAGKELFMSYGSVHYHMKKIKEKTGLDPKKFYELIELVKEVKGDDEE